MFVHAPNYLFCCCWVGSGYVEKENIAPIGQTLFVDGCIFDGKIAALGNGFKLKTIFRV